MLARLLPFLLLALPAAAETVEIIRDPFGTPQIFATTAAGAAFGAGYAQAEDRIDALLRNLKAANPGNLDGISPAMRAMLEAYAAGVNRYRPDAGVTAAQVAAFARQALARFRGASIFLDRTRSSSGAVLAILDTQANWNADDRPYEMSLSIAQGDVTVAGVAPLGVPFPVTAHTRTIAVAWSPGAGSLDQAWAMLTATNVEGIRKALGGTIPRDLLAGDASGELLSNAMTKGYALQGVRTEQSSAALHQLLARQNKWSVGLLSELAFSAEVYKAETWQARLSKVDPGHPFTQMLTGWNRRAAVDSRPALAFYLFKMELGRDAAAIEPPDTLENSRIISALKRAQDRLETTLEFGAAFGTLFRIARDGSRKSYPVGGGTVTEAGMEMPRALTYLKGPTLHIATSGQSAVRIVDLANPSVSAVSVLMPGVTDEPGSAHFEDQAKELFSKARTKPAFFANRRELERRSSSKKQLIF